MKETRGLVGAALVLLVAGASAGCGNPVGRAGGGDPDGGGSGGAAGGGQGGDQGGAGGGGGGGQGGAAQPDAAPQMPFTGEYADPSAGADPKSAFAGGSSSDASARPKFAYPFDGAMLGRNIGGMNLQWSAGSGNTLFRISVAGNGTAVLYAGASVCPGGKCRLPVPDDFWKNVATANAGAGVTVTIDGVSAAGMPVATSAALKLNFTPDSLQGGLYYFSTKLPGIMRVKLGENTPEPFITPMSAANPTPCAGCHALTRDGCRMALTYEGGEGHMGIVDAVNGQKTYISPTKDYSNFQTWNPDGTRLMTLKKGEMVLRDNVGTVISRVPRMFVGAAGNDTATHPEWSPDGNTIAFTRLASGSMVRSDWWMSGDIMLMPYNNGSFGPAKVLVAHDAQDNHYYPHFSPDSKWVVFNSGKKPGKSPAVVPANELASYDQTNARLRLVSVAGGTPIELTNATHIMNKVTSWPKFSPFAQQSGNLLFIVFSSRFDYGWLLEQDTVIPQPKGLYGRPQLWVAAIDVSKSGDPSYAPFWLPFQRTDDGNHLGYWTTRIPGKTAGPVDCANQ